MNIEESIQQINELIEAWELNEACLNQTDIDAIKCLLKQNKELKQKYLNAVADYETTMAEKKEMENQQKKFIEYLEKTIEELEYDDVDDEEMKGYLIQRIDTFKEILSKYKEIIGENNNKLLRKSE